VRLRTGLLLAIVVIAAATLLPMTVIAPFGAKILVAF
jgi:hypothetical protein